jgi:hypothetical protein
MIATSLQIQSATLPTCACGNLIRYAAAERCEDCFAHAHARDKAERAADYAAEVIPSLVEIRARDFAALQAERKQRAEAREAAAKKKHDDALKIERRRRKELEHSLAQMRKQLEAAQAAAARPAKQLSLNDSSPADTTPVVPFQLRAEPDRINTIIARRRGFIS